MEHSDCELNATQRISCFSESKDWRRTTATSEILDLFFSLCQMTNQTLTFSFVIQQDIPVMNLQPAIVKVYDYYETGEQEIRKEPKAA